MVAIEMVTNKSDIGTMSVHPRGCDPKTQDYGYNRHQSHAVLLHSKPTEHQLKDLPQTKRLAVRHSLGTGELRGVGEVKASGQHRSSGYNANREHETASSVHAPSSSTHLRGHPAARRQDRQRQTKPEHRSKGGDYNRTPQTKSPLTRGEWVNEE